MVPRSKSLLAGANRGRHLEHDEPVQWNGSSTHIYVWDCRFPARIALVNPWTAERKAWLETMAPDPSGVLYCNFFITPDGKTCAYRFRRVLTTLFLGDGLL